MTKLSRAVVLFTALVALAAGASAFYQSEFSTATVFLRAPSGDTSQQTSQRVADVADKALSRTALVTVIRNLGLYRNQVQHQPLEDVVEQMRQAITIQPADGGRVKVEFRGENSKAVADYLESRFMDAGFESEGVTTDPPSSAPQAKLEAGAATKPTA